MAEVIFDEDKGEKEFHIRSRRLFGDPETPTMIKFLLDHKIVKNEKQAMYILIGVVVVFLGATLYTYKVMNDTPTDITLRDGSKIPVKEYIEGVKKGLY